MKKLSILIALILCATIGGVYATWNYAETTDITDGYYEIKATIADAVMEGANGTYTVTSNAVIIIDDANNDKEAELVFKSNSVTDPNEEVFVKITFTPAAHATPEIKQNAVESEIYYGVTSEMKAPVDANGNYSETGTLKDIFVFSNVKNGTLEPNVVWNENGDGGFEYTLDKAALEDAIKLNGKFILNTKADHDAFREALGGNIKVYVTDGTGN